MNKFQKILLFAFLALTSVSCSTFTMNKTTLFKANVVVEVDWSSFDKEKPTGMTVLAYPYKGGIPAKVISNNIRFADIQLQEGLHHVVAFNQIPEDFGTLAFDIYTSYNSARVYSLTSNSEWYKGIQVARDVEWFATSTDQAVSITSEMVSTSRNEYVQNAQEKTEHLVSIIKPLNVVKDVYVKVNIDGIENVRAVKATVSGLAAGYSFSNEAPLAGTVTHECDNWRICHDDYDYTKGYVLGKIRCFGLPSGHSKLPESNKVRLTLLLQDGQTYMDYAFEVGDMLNADQESGRVQFEFSLGDAIPDVEHVDGGNSGFNATVGGWNDDENHSLPVNN